MFDKKTIAGLQSGRFDTQLKVGRYYEKVTITVERGRMLFHYPFNRAIGEEIKVQFAGRQYHGYLDGDGRHLWSAPINFRNLFRLDAMQKGTNPYSRWDKPKDLSPEIDEHWAKRNSPEGKKPYSHQKAMINLGLNALCAILAADMGTGKTLSAIVAAEMCGLYKPGHMYWAGPRSALAAAKLEFSQWRTKLDPEFVTYEGLKKAVANWHGPAPQILILDEASRCKTPGAQRSEATLYLADNMRKEYGDECMILELSGSPAPKSPPDWWMLAEIVCPGFLKEKDWHTFKERLGHFEEFENDGGQKYKKLKTWKDSTDKCGVCGELKSSVRHLDMEENLIAGGDGSVHEFIEGPNEVAQLEKRLKGLVGVWMSEDCLDLPEMRFQTIQLPPSTDTLNAAKAVLATTTRAADALIKLRTISDGFLYSKEPTGEMETCPGCEGLGVVKDYSDGTATPKEISCHTCNGKKEVDKMHRVVIEVDCPKIDLFKSLLSRCEEDGRMNSFAGFQGSIDRLEKTALAAGWAAMRIDGRGWRFTDPIEGELSLSDSGMLTLFQEGQERYPKVVSVINAASGGMGLTLTASPLSFFYSNSFNPEDRLQALKRHHRLGMLKHGGLVIDCVHLKTDQRVLDSLNKSRDLMHMSMKGLEEDLA